MKTKLNFATNFLTTAVAIVALGVLTADAQRMRSGSFQGSRGISGTFDQTMKGQPGLYMRGTTVQTANGLTGYRNVTDTWKPGSGTANRSAVTTAPNGKTATVNQTASRTGNNTATVNGSRTGYDGQTSTWNKTATANGNGTATINGQYTGQKGNAATTSTTATKTANGYTATGTYNTSTGKNGNYSVDVVNADGTHTRTETVTGADGKPVTRVVTTDANGNTIDRNVSTTGPNGQTSSHSGSATVNQ
jgi:hypothetical protein